MDAVRRRSSVRTQDLLRPRLVPGQPGRPVGWRLQRRGDGRGAGVTPGSL